MFQNVTAVELVVIFGSILVSMGIHEAMHAFTSHWLGDSTAKDLGRLTLNPLKHIDIMTTVLLPVLLIAVGLPPIFIAKPVPFNPDRVKYDEFGAALIGIAGPLTNLALAAIAALIVRISGIAVGTDLFLYISDFIIVNLGFFVFNMIPFPPLDGSRLLYAFAPEPLQRFLYTIESGGITSIFILFAILYMLPGQLIGNIIESLYRVLLG